jgi:TatD DNase family protein
MRYFDSHSHYYDERFAEECPEGVDALLGKLFGESVSGIVNVGTRLETCRLAIEQAKKYENMYTALGIHPSDIWLEREDMGCVLDELKTLILDKRTKCVALGEIGLDYHYPDTDIQKQKEYFDAQMRMARELSMPVVIHDRDAHGDCMEIVRRHPEVKGVFHSFSGSAQMAEELVDLGYMISFSGTLTFTNARKPKEAAAAVPLDRILIETDCPYLAPHPKRGTLNHSGNLSYTAIMLASIKGISPSECAEITENNAKRFYGLWTKE